MLNRIYCPFLEVEILDISSKVLDNIGDFPIFMLSAIEIGAEPEMIANSVCLGDAVISDTLDELEKYGLISKKKSGIRIRKLGRQYIRIAEFIRNFKSDSNRRYAVNCFTCQLEDVSRTEWFDKKEKPSSGKICLRNKLFGSEYLIRTPNYENVLEYMKDKLDLTNVGITGDDYEYISIRIKVKPPYRVFYVPYEITKESYMEYSEDTVDTFEADVPISVIKREFVLRSFFQIEDQKLLEAVMYLKDSAYLSEKGKELLEDIESADKINNRQKKPLFYMDRYSGCQFDSKLTDVTHKKPIIKLDPQTSIRTGYQSVPNHDDILYHLIEVKQINQTVTVDFNKLKQLRGDDY